MTPEEFRRHGRELVDWVADCMERVGSLPAQAQVERARSARYSRIPLPRSPSQAVLPPCGSEVDSVAVDLRG
jgi:aromatic-L-amino-acid/L-tryptophan decarboxylase